MNSLLTKLYYLRSFLRFRAYGSNVQLMRGGLFVRPDEVTLGDNVFIARNFLISARSLTIGSNVMIGPNLVMECDDHRMDRVGVNMRESSGNRIVSPVSIEDDVWIGANVVILKGVTIREGSVVGAGSIVTKSTPPYSVSFGNPCKPMRTRFTAEQIGTHLASVPSRYTPDAIVGMWRDAGLISP